MTGDVLYNLASFYIQVNRDGKVLLGQNVDEERREAKQQGLQLGEHLESLIS